MERCNKVTGECTSGCRQGYAGEGCLIGQCSQWGQQIDTRDLIPLLIDAIIDRSVRDLLLCVIFVVCVMFQRSRACRLRHEKNDARPTRSHWRGDGGENRQIRATVLCQPILYITPLWMVTTHSPWSHSACELLSHASGCSVCAIIQCMLYRYVASLSHLFWCVMYAANLNLWFRM